MGNIFNNTHSQLFFGQDEESQVGRYIKYLGGSKVLLHYAKAGGPIEGLLDNVRRSLRSCGLDYVELAGVEDNPRVQTVLDAVMLCRRERVNFILGIGSVPVFFSSKMISAAVHFDGSFYSLFNSEIEPENVIPLGLISTTVCGGLANSHRASVSNRIDDGSLHYYTLISESLVPKFVIYNPELCLYDDKDLGYSIVRIISTLLTKYFTPSGCEELSEKMIQTSMKVVLSTYYKLKEKSYDLDSLCNLMWTSINAHISKIFASGRMISLDILIKAVCSVYDCSHEQASALVWLGFLEYTCVKNHRKLAQLGTDVFGIQADFSNIQNASKTTLYAFRYFFKSVGLPVRLTDLGGSGADIQKILSKAGFPEVDVIGDFEQLNRNDCEVILSLVV